MHQTQSDAALQVGHARLRCRSWRRQLRVVLQELEQDDDEVVTPRPETQHRGHEQKQKRKFGQKGRLTKEKKRRGNFLLQEYFWRGNYFLLQQKLYDGRENSHLLTRLDHSVFNSEPARCPHRAGSVTRTINEMDWAGPGSGSQTMTSFFTRKPTCLTALGLLRLTDRKNRHETIQNQKKKTLAGLWARPPVLLPARRQASHSSSFQKKQNCTRDTWMAQHLHHVARCPS